MFWLYLINLFVNKSIIFCTLVLLIKYHHITLSQFRLIIKIIIKIRLLQQRCGRVEVRFQFNSFLSFLKEGFVYMDMTHTRDMKVTMD